MTDVVIPEGVEAITLSAFSEREIQSVSFPTSLRAIDDYAFYKCKNLVRIDLPDSFGGAESRGIFRMFQFIRSESISRAYEHWAKCVQSLRNTASSIPEASSVSFSENAFME